MGRAWLCLIAACGCGRIGFAEQSSGDGRTLSLAPATSTINVGSKVTLTTSGGTPPYNFTVTGGGTFDGTVFTAPNRAGLSVVTVTDAELVVASADITYRGAQLFVIGGLVGTTPTDTVLASSDGVTWTQVGQLPAARNNGAVVVYDDRIFYLGGLGVGDVPSAEVYASSDGATWSPVGTLPMATTGFTAAVHAGEIWFVGGFTGSINSGAAYHSRDGATWTRAAGSLAVSRHEHDLISRGDRLYVLGGHSDSAFLDTVDWTIDGARWTTSAGQLTFAADFPAAGELGDRVFRVCGVGCTSTETSLDLETWTPGAPLPAERESPALVGFGDRLLLVGGDTTVLATIDGASWQEIGSLPAARGRTAAVQFTRP